MHIITKKGGIGKRFVDKLIQIYRLDGQIKWILVPIEVQDKREDNFSERMFVYFYRIYERYKETVISCAILTNCQTQRRPSYFEIGFSGSTLRFELSNS